MCVGLLRSMAAAASIRCMREMKVRVVKSQIAIPFFLKLWSPVLQRINLSIASHYIILYSD
jgi:hypothetical protein